MSRTNQKINASLISKTAEKQAFHPSAPEVMVPGMPMAEPKGEYGQTRNLLRMPGLWFFAIFLLLFVVACGDSSNPGRGSGQPPSISLSAPGEGASIAVADLLVEGSVSDDAEGGSVAIALDATYSTAASGNPDFSATIPAANLSVGAHTITATATDADDLTASATVHVTIVDPTGDTSAPSVALGAPANGATFAPGEISITGTAWDDVGLAAVEISIDGTPPVSVVGLEDWRYLWDASDASPGTHTVVVTARDAANNTSQADISISLSEAGGNPGVFNIVTQSHNVDEAVGSVTFVVERSGGTQGAVSVDWTTQPQTASYLDYQGADDVFHWDDGEGGQKQVSIPIVDDTDPEDSEYFDFRIENPQGGAALGNDTSISITINANDTQAINEGTVRIITSSQTVYEGDIVQVQFERVGGTDGAVSVGWRTSQNTATEGDDYVGQQETLNWTDGAGGIITRNVTILDDTDAEAAENFRGAIQNAQGGVSIDSGAAEITLTIAASDTTLDGPVYYIAPDGEGNNEDDGSIETPWATAAYAATQVSSGETIFFNAGTHTISSPVDVGVGVNLTGAGNSSIISIPITAPDYAWVFRLGSDTTNTDGNQSISFLRFVGPGDQGEENTNFNGAIKVDARGNVHIQHCEFEDFDDNAVTFSGQPHDGNSEPSVWSVGNSFHNNRVVNCARRQPSVWMSGALQIGTQEGMRIYDNYFQENQRGASYCGYNIKYYSNGYNRDLKIYGNTLIKLPSINDDYDWNFAIELWRYRGAVEIFNNHIEGSIDVDHVVKGAYEYGVRIHDNEFGYDTLPTSSGTWANLNAAVYIEFSSADIEIYNNVCKNLEAPFRFSPRDGDVMENIFIHHNVVHSLGNDDDDTGCNVLNFAGEGSWTVRNLRFEHNAIYTDVGNAGYGLIFPGQTMENIYIRNNIFQGFDNNPIEFNGTLTDYLYIENNNFYGNGSNTPNITGSPTHFVNQKNISEDPLFLDAPDDLSLQPESKCINAGLDAGYTIDIIGNSLDVEPDIGAYESMP